MMAASTLTDPAAEQQQPSEAQHPKLRPASVAGAFYPADATTLTAIMDGMLAHVSGPLVEGQILAAVAPHAGYVYSGPVAAHTYASLKGRRYARVVVIAPSHYEGFGFTSIYDGDGYITPLGIVPVDVKFVRELAGIDASIQISERGHVATSRGAEHAIEVQLPWLQHVLGNFSLVPVVMGNQSYESSLALGEALANLIRQRENHVAEGAHELPGDTLIVASSDLSHYHTSDEAEKIDRQTLNGLEAWDYLKMSCNFKSRVWEACGGAPIITAMIAAERLGANRASVLNYANSGEVSGDSTCVVGYGAGVFVKTKNGNVVQSAFSLNEEEENQLLGLAQNAVERAVRSHTLYQPQATGNDVLDQNCGAFVTLMEAGKLRGCVGYTAAAQPLYKTVRDTATLAALRDPRFPPVTEDELPELQYELSVLSSLVRVDDVSQIEIGKHGLLLRNGNREGLLLPQVAVEHHWDRSRFLQETCLKAGLAPDCWTHCDTEIFCFSAIVFGDRRTSVSDRKGCTRGTRVK